MIKKTDVDILLEAKDHVANGWVQHMSFGPDNTVCMRGALYKACGVNGAITPYISDEEQNDLNTITRKVDQLIVHYIKPVISTCGVTIWNDMKERTQAQVVGALDNAARLAKEQQDQQNSPVAKTNPSSL